MEIIKDKKGNIGKPKTRSMTEKELITYNCRWCGTEFKQYVCKVGGNPKADGTRAQAQSDQVRCPQCDNFLPTWGDE